MNRILRYIAVFFTVVWMVGEVQGAFMPPLAMLGLVGIASMRKTRKIIVTAILAIGAGTANAAFNDVTNSIAISNTPFVYNRATGTFDTLISLRNIGIERLNSPMYVVVTKVPDSVSVNSATNISPDGHPMVQLPGDKSGLAPGATIVNVRVRFYNPKHIRFMPALKSSHLPAPLSRGIPVLPERRHSLASTRTEMMCGMTSSSI